MNIATKSRADLYTFFKRNKVPTEANFADLIDASLNQRDDGIAKPEDGPLSLQGTGAADGPRPVLNLYRSFDDEQGAAWTVALNPRTDPADAASARVGLGLTDGAGALKFFVADGSGDVWSSGSVTARNFHGAFYGPVDVSGPVGEHPAGRDGVLYRFGGQVYLTVDDHFFVRDSADGDGWKFHFNTDSGDLDMPNGNLNFGRTVRQMINLWREGYGIGVQSYTTYFRSDRNFAWFRGGTHDNATFNPGAGGQVMLRLTEDGTLHPANASIETGTLSFGAQVRQMINLWRESYGIGVQSHTAYFRSAESFAWYRGGAHSNAKLDPGGGDLVMKLDETGRLTIDSGANTGLSLNDNVFVDGQGGTGRITNNAFVRNSAWAIADGGAQAFTVELRDSGMMELYGTRTPGQADWHKLATFDAGSVPGNRPQAVKFYPDVEIHSAKLDFGAQTRQMIDLWRSEYGIGVQSGTTYFRTHSAFAWFHRGTHHDTQFNAGAGGVTMMRLPPTGVLSVGGVDFSPNRADHPGFDGCVYRFGGQAYIGVDDNLFIRDTNTGAINFHFNTDNGFLRAVGWHTTSDASLKRGVKRLDGALARLQSIEGVRYRWRRDGADGPQHLGFVAQDVEKVFPELVADGSDGKKTLEYTGLIAPIVEAIKEQQAQIAALEARLAEVAG